MNKPSFSSPAYGEAFGRLLPNRLPELGPGSPNTEVKSQLKAISLEAAFAGRRVTDEAAAQCCLSAIWLAHDFLDESHAISQEVDSLEGSYWHAIMHRREPDYGNAKYWFRRVPEHPIFEPLAESARDLAGKAKLDGPAEFLTSQAKWDVYRFVDLCEAIARGRSPCEMLAREVARVEWQLLFDHCYRQAIGAP